MTFVLNDIMILVPLFYDKYKDNWGIKNENYLNLIILTMLTIGSNANR